MSKAKTAPQAQETVTEQVNDTQKVTDTQLASEWDKMTRNEGESLAAPMDQSEESSAEEHQEPQNGQQALIQEDSDTSQNVDAKNNRREEDAAHDQLADEPTDNAERSRLGRRLKQVEEINRQILEELQALKSSRGETEKPGDDITFDDNYLQSRLDEAVEKGLIPSTIVTPQDQIRVNNYINYLQTEMSNQYASRYLNTLKSPHLKGDTPDDIHAEVLTELQRVESPYNLNRFNNPVVDAQMNYLEAKNAILQKRLAEGKQTNSVFKGRANNTPPIGTSVSSKTATHNDELPELDEAALDFIKREGLSPDSVRAALKRDLPLYLRRPR